VRRLRDAYRDDPRTQGLLEAVRGGSPRTIGACHGSLPVVLLAAAVAEWDGDGPFPARILVGNDPDTLIDDCEELGLVAHVLPELDHFADDEDEGDRTGMARRRAALERYLAGEFLCCTPHAFAQPVPEFAGLAESEVVLRPGSEVDLHGLAERLVDEGYRLSQVVEAPGQLAVRGGLLDVFPLSAREPWRIETFGDEVDELRRFDPFTQETIAHEDELALVVGRQGLPVAELWRQLPADAPLLIFADVSLRDRQERPHDLAELRFARQLEEGAEDGGSVGVQRYVGDAHRDLPELAAAAGEGAAITLLARNEEAAAQWRVACDDHGIDARIARGRLEAGWRDQERGWLVVHDFELSHRRPVRRRATRVAGGTPLSSLADLRPGDLVVHLNHGIARFRGLSTLERRGYMEDFLLCEFAEESKLYVPVDAIELVQKYVGGAGRHPPLSRLGGRAWQRKRRKAEKAVEDLAGELLEAQARRIEAGGHAFPKDGPAQRRFEARFPFEETADQLAAMREIKDDLEAERAMDRLLCGDVGFGKTELAMRAAFKVATAGKQVALLAPTTILAEQHAETFEERFEGTGLAVGCVNRFRRAAERRALVDAAAAGEVAVLIGTHALLSEEVAFADLGLLIVDEEQRFGVKHKEKLKRLRAGIDVLTLSATPIPRTLHFGLLGLRDISVLAEAPAERLAIRTRVAPWDKGLISRALERELARDGQVFVVHNRVRDIDRLARRLERLVPEMRLEVVHGQMPEERIARTMRRFQHREIDCLVGTSILESGLDIPNANTLIVDDAHRYGLAELHQIRGRIGRFTRQAYAYFLVPVGRPLGDEARQRLEAIQEYAELGAGFKLAMRDLELRGAGNLLGAEQSGHIEAIGYELYCRLLADACARRRGEAPPGLPGADRARLAFPVDAYVPDDYCESPSLKFELHKAVDGCAREGELADATRSARDRFGPLPDPVARLIRVKAIRLRADDLGIRRIEHRGRQLRLHLEAGVPDVLVHGSDDAIHHVQVDEKDRVLVAFLRDDLDQDALLLLICKLLQLDMGYLGRGF